MWIELQLPAGCPPCRLGKGDVAAKQDDALKQKQDQTSARVLMHSCLEFHALRLGRGGMAAQREERWQAANPKPLPS